MNPQTGELLVNEVAPRIRSSLAGVTGVGSEDREELEQDAVAMAAGLLESLEARGKQVTPGNVAYFAVKQIRQGRRSTGFFKSDAHHPAAQVSGRSRVVSLEEPVKYEEGSDDPLVLGEVLACEAEDPSATGARNLDWQAFTETLDELARAILQCLADERPLLEVAHAVGMSRSTIQSHKNRLSEAVLAFMGPGLLRELQRPTQWRINIRAVRERLACRFERQAA
jgi:DNA-directed RNA polymerase specialized sigma24 family protein